MEIYLDHHATTPCDPAVVRAMQPFWSDVFGNAASRSHRWGVRARQATEHARGQLSLRLGCSPKEIVFTSGATEANNLAVLGLMRSSVRKHVVTVATEHQAVLDTVQQAEREGCRVTLLPVESNGRIDLGRLEEAVGPDTALVSVMWANNETGVLQDLEEIARIAHEHGALLHSDGAQALATEPIDLRSSGIDLLSISAHKAYGPKGIGALIVRRRHPKISLQPLIHGGGHERGLRSGTLPVPLVVGFGVAAQLYSPKSTQRVKRLRDRLRVGLLALHGVEMNGSEEHRLPSNLNLTIHGVEAKALLMACPQIAMSSGSACTSASLKPSHVLAAMGLHEHSLQTLRLGLGRPNTEAEVDATLQLLRAKIPELRQLNVL